MANEKINRCRVGRGMSAGFCCMLIVADQSPCATHSKVFNILAQTTTAASESDSTSKDRIGVRRRSMSHLKIFPVTKIQL